MEEYPTIAPLFQDFEHPKDFSPGEYHVIIASGRKSQNHAGNVRFRCLIESKLDEYSEAKSKAEKSVILGSTVQNIRDGANKARGGFVKFDKTTSRWAEVGNFLAREKTSQAFRDVLHVNYRSSKESKKKRRHFELNLHNITETRRRVEQKSACNQLEYENVSGKDIDENSILIGVGLNQDEELFKHLSLSLSSLIDENDEHPFEPRPMWDEMETAAQKDEHIKEENHIDVLNSYASISCITTPKPSQLKALSTQHQDQQRHEPQQCLSSFKPTQNVQAASTA